MNTNFGKLEDGKLTYAPVELVIDGKRTINPNAGHYASQGWLPLITDNQPTAVGVTYSPSGWALNAQGTAIERVWTATPIVAPVKVWSVEEVIYGLITHDALAAVKQIVGDYWELFTMRDVIEADNEIFAEVWPNLKAAIVASGAISEEDLDWVMADAEVK